MTHPSQSGSRLVGRGYWCKRCWKECSGVVLDKGKEGGGLGSCCHSLESSFESEDKKSCLIWKRMERVRERERQWAWGERETSYNHQLVQIGAKVTRFGLNGYATVTPDNFRCVLQCAIRSNSITKVRSNRRHDLVSKKRWYQWGMSFREGKNALLLSVSFAPSPAVSLSKIWRHQSTDCIELAGDRRQRVRTRIDMAKSLRFARTFLGQLKKNPLEGLCIRTSW